MPGRAQRIERAFGAALFALPLWYVASEHSAQPALWTWSTPWALLVALVLAGYVALLVSYARPRAMRFELVRRRITLVSAGLLFGLAGAELVLRSLDGARFEERDNSGRHAPDPDLGHVYVPDHRQLLQTREYSVEWRSNAQGVRAEREYGPKPRGLTRVLCVGDSFTACDQVPYAQCWPAVLEQRLNARLEQAGLAQRIETVNAGFPGYCTANEARWIAKFGARFEPDIVLVATTPNDLSENVVPLQYAARDGKLVRADAGAAEQRRFEHRSQWWCLAGALERSRLAAAVRASSVVARVRGKPGFHHAEAYQSPPTERARQRYELAERYMLEARDAATALGARFAILVIPYSRQLQPFESGYDGGAYAAHWREFATRHGLDFADAREPMLAYEGGAPLYWKEDNHCTAAGYALVAQAAEELLWERREALGWTP